MRLLVVKMSSLGDVVHTLPAITDAVQQIKDLHIDWVVEEAFRSIPLLHPAVGMSIPIALRRWRQHPTAARPEVAQFIGRIRQHPYDLVLDAQGLIKSAAVALLARGERAGFDARSAREAVASFTYQRRIGVERGRHAVFRCRQLFAEALGYRIDDVPADFGLRQDTTRREHKIMLLHGTTWANKHWPDSYWQTLVRLITADGFGVLIPHGNDEELARARFMATGDQRIEILPRASLGQLCDQLRRCAGVVTVDTGLGHLANAIGIPLVGLFGPTDPRLTGPVGSTQTVLASDHLPCIPCLKKKCQFDRSESTVYPPCFEGQFPERVWATLRAQIDRDEVSQP
jgi:heptosyltransferase I